MADVLNLKISIVNEKKIMDIFVTCINQTFF